MPAKGAWVLPVTAAAGGSRGVAAAAPPGSSDGRAGSSDGMAGSAGDVTTAATGPVTATVSAIPCTQPAAPNSAETPMMTLADDPADERAPAVPDPAPGVPGSGSGSGAPSGGNANPAWLSSFRLHLAGTLNIPARGDLLAPPSPVSFDPGSSPD